MSEATTTRIAFTRPVRLLRATAPLNDEPAEVLAKEDFRLHTALTNVGESTLHLQFGDGDVITLEPDEHHYGVETEALVAWTDGPEDYLQVIALYDEKRLPSPDYLQNEYGDLEDDDSGSASEPL